MDTSTALRPASACSTCVSGGSSSFSPRTAGSLPIVIGHHAGAAAGLADRVGSAAVVTFLLVWISLFTFNPAFVRVVRLHDIHPAPGAEPDPVKCFLYAVVIALAAFVATWVVTRQMARLAAARAVLRLSSSSSYPGGK